ncbi:MAG: hypothetical protein QXJ17_06330 [Nitrososphaeria archaeon]
MSEVEASLREIKEELKEIRSLYKELIERIIPVETPLSDEKKAIESRDEIVSEDELMKALD